MSITDDSKELEIIKINQIETTELINTQSETKILAADLSRNRR